MFSDVAKAILPRHPQNCNCPAARLVRLPSPPEHTNFVSVSFFWGAQELFVFDGAGSFNASSSPTPSLRDPDLEMEEFLAKNPKMEKFMAKHLEIEEFQRKTNVQTFRRHGHNHPMASSSARYFASDSQPFSTLVHEFQTCILLCLSTPHVAHGHTAYTHTRTNAHT